MSYREPLKKTIQERMGVTELQELLPLTHGGAMDTDNPRTTGARTGPPLSCACPARSAEARRGGMTRARCAVSCAGLHGPRRVDGLTREGYASGQLCMTSMPS